MGLPSWQCDYSVFVHQLGVRTDNGVPFIKSYACCDSPKISQPPVFNTLFQKPIYGGTLVRNSPCVFRDISFCRYIWHDQAEIPIERQKSL